MEANALAKKTAEVANRDNGVVEVPKNSNDGPRIRQYQEYTGAPYNSSYCASACSLWVHDASIELSVTPAFKKSARALGLWERNVTLQIKKEDLTPEMLPCIGIHDHGDGHGHAYLAVGFDPTTGKIQSVDPNSNPHGSYNGGGVHVLDIRSIHDAELKGFIQIA